jgi:hypothetical protein
MMADQLARDV